MILRNGGHVFHCPVPGDHLLAVIKDKSCVREELDDIHKLPVGFFKLPLGLLHPGNIP